MSQGFKTLGSMPTNSSVSVKSIAETLEPASDMSKKPPGKSKAWKEDIEKKMVQTKSTLVPLILMLIVQTCFAVTNLLYKAAIADGMNIVVAVVYRFVVGSVLMIIMAFLKERNQMQHLNWKIVLRGFFCGLFGGALFQTFYATSLKYTSATIATAMSNLEPGFTFLLAVLFRMESANVGTRGGQAKVAGTITCIGGAMLLTFYKGIEINVKSMALGLFHLHAEIQSKSQHTVLGSFLAIASAVFYSLYLIIQATMSEDHPFHYTNAAIICTTTSIVTVVYALIEDREWSHWQLGFNIRLFAVLFSGIFTSGLCSMIISWCVQQKGPLYVSIFSPFMLLVVAIGGVLMINEKLYVGSILGGLITVIGLYAVLWGQSKETKLS
ncbi:hypothetical protein OROHE_023920 [Orobanche hederae]